jgi:hypothetical protein
VGSSTAPVAGQVPTRCETLARSAKQFG